MGYDQALVKQPGSRAYPNNQDMPGFSAEVSGDFSNWDPSYKIMLGNEAEVNSDRFWPGELYYVLSLWIKSQWLLLV